MKRVIRIVVGTAIGLAAGVLLYLSLVLWRGGEFAEPLAAVSLGTCTTLTGIVGAEDAVADWDTGIVYISAFDRRSARGKEPVRGKIFALEPRAVPPLLRDVTPTEPSDFKPHGIAYYGGGGGRRTLFVINHNGTNGQRVEAFDIDGFRLYHRETISTEAFLSLNDIAPVGPRSFYATNDHIRPPGLLRNVLDLLHLSSSNVVYFDGDIADPVAEGLAFANGIAVSDDGENVYVTETLGRRLSIYQRDLTRGTLKRERRVPLGTGADNIDIDGAGMLWIAGHPKLYPFIRHAIDANQIAPSQVVTFDPAAENAAPKTVFADPGQLISAASVAVNTAGKVLIGSVFDPKILLCEPSAVTSENDGD